MKSQDNRCNAGDTKYAFAFVVKSTFETVNLQSTLVNATNFIADSSSRGVNVTSFVPLAHSTRILFMI